MGGTLGLGLGIIGCSVHEFFLKPRAKPRRFDTACRAEEASLGQLASLLPFLSQTYISSAKVR